MGKTGISWTDETWNPTKGCSRISEGCQHCYAEVQAARIVRMGKGKPTAYDGLVRVTAGGDPRWTGVVTLDPRALARPLSWRKPRRIFVNSMSDLFHESLTNEQIAAVFGVMAACPQHTFQVLTKRARRMREWFEWAGRLTLDHLRAFAQEALDPRRADCYRRGTTWPLPNVWLGVSVEDQDAADERIPELLRTPAVFRFLSCEPLLGPVDLHAIQIPAAPSGLRFSALQRHHDDRYGQSDIVLDWVIAGCESGDNARPCDVDWLRSLRDQCDKADVAFFLKQAVQQDDIQEVCEHCRERVRYHVVGVRDTLCRCACTVEGPEAADWHPPIGVGEGSRRKPGGLIELPYLDGVQHAAFPEASNA